MIELNDVSVSVIGKESNRYLARHLTLRVEPQTIQSIVGPSGSGKSTLLRSIVKLSPHSHGSIRISGRSIDSFHPAELRTNCIYLQQHPVLFPNSVEFNLQTAFSFRVVKRSFPNISKLQSVISEVGLDADILEKNALTLSGGEAQRVALARALLLDPDILLLDEPTASLDNDSAEVVIVYLKEWVKKGDRAVLWIVHERDVIRKLNIKPLMLTPNGFTTENQVKI